MGRAQAGPWALGPAHVRILLAIYVYVYGCMYMYMYISMYICVYVYMCICVYLVPGTWYQVPGTWYRVISRLISDHLEHFMRQIEGNCDPNLIRGVPGPKNRKIKNP